MAISEYTILDQTDYLQMTAKGHVTRNVDPQAAVVPFRIDDNAVANPNRTRIANVAFTRE